MGLDDLDLSPTTEAAAPAAFRVDVRRDSVPAVVAPHGELDLATVGLLDEQLHAHRRSVVLDLRGVSFMDSTGLSLVLRHAASRGAEFTVVDGPHAVSRLFDLTSAREFVNFVPGA